MKAIDVELFDQMVGKAVIDIQKRRLLEKRKQMEELDRKSSQLFNELIKISNDCDHKYLVKIDHRHYCLDCFGLVGEHLITKDMKVLHFHKEDDKSDLEVLEEIYNVYNQILLSNKGLSPAEAFDELIISYKVSPNNIKRLSRTK